VHATSLFSETDRAASDTTISDIFGTEIRQWTTTATVVVLLTAPTPRALQIRRGVQVFSLFSFILIYWISAV
jgi:hypothetical protein